jgi:hypothetical protein
MRTYPVWYPVSVVGAGTAGCQRRSGLRSAGVEPDGFDSGSFSLGYLQPDLSGVKQKPATPQRWAGLIRQ